LAAICALTLSAACRLGYQQDFDGDTGRLSPQRSVTTGAAAAGSAAGQTGTDAGMGGSAQEIVGGKANGGVTSLAGEPSISGSSATGDGGAADAGGAGGSDAGPVDACGGCALGNVCMSGSCSPAKRVFITDKTYLPDFGSAAAANQICQSTANTRKLGGTWLAWIADSKFSPATDFDQSAEPYVLLDGTLIASDWADLIDGMLAHPIDMNELHATIGSRETWTGVYLDGTASSDNCLEWTSNVPADLGTNGVSSVGDYGWSDIYLQFCDRWVSLYCFEQ
jgi:hypothetical protein